MPQITFFPGQKTLFTSMEPYELEFELQKTGRILTHMLTDLIVQKAKPKGKMYNISDGDRKGLCLRVARHGALLGGESPLRAVSIGTASLGKDVCREAESEGS